MNAVSFDIKTLIEEDSSLGLVFGTNLFIGRKPAAPSDCVTLYDVAGMAPDLCLNKEGYNRDALQIVVRNTSYVTAMTTAWQLADFLQGQSNIVLDNIQYTLLRVVITPTVLEWDEDNCVLVLFSIEAQRR